MQNERKQTSWLIIFFLFSFATEAKELKLKQSEKDCLARNVYHEMRSKPKNIRLIVANIALNRKKTWNKKQKFGAKSNHLCDIVKSKEYSSVTAGKIKEKEIYAKISQELMVSKLTGHTEALFFHTKDGKFYVN